MNLLEEYYKEKYNCKVIKNDNGILLFEQFDDNSIYIHVLYVTPKQRNKEIGYGLEQELIRSFNPSSIYCDIDKTSNGWEEAVAKFIHKSGYKVCEVTDSKIILFKELK